MTTRTGELFEKLFLDLTKPVVQDPSRENYYRLWLELGNDRLRELLGYEQVPNDTTGMATAIVNRLSRQMLQDIEGICPEFFGAIIPVYFAILLKINPIYDGLKESSLFRLYLERPDADLLVTALLADPILNQMNGRQLNRVSDYIPRYFERDPISIVIQDGKVFVVDRLEQRDDWELYANREDLDTYNLDQRDRESGVPSYGILQKPVQWQPISLLELYRQHKLSTVYVLTGNDGYPGRFVSLVEIGNNDDYQS